MSVPLIQTGGGSSLATPVSLANGGTHADLSATGGVNQVLKQSSVGANISVAALVQSDIPSMLSLIGSLPNARVVSSYTAFTTPANGAQCDIYTVPSGKKAVLFGMHVSNATGGAASTFQPTVKISGVYQKLSAAAGTITSTAAGAGQGGFLPGGVFIAEVGEIFSIVQATSTTFFVVATILEFDDSSPLRSIRLIAPASGDNNFYTPSGSKNGLVTGNTLLANGNTAPTAAFMFNGTVGAITVKWNYRRGAAAAGTSNLITGSASVSAGVTAQAGSLNCITVANGDTLSANLSAANASGWLWLNVLEFLA